VTIDDNDVFTAQQAATYLGISRRSLDHLALERLVYTPRLLRYARQTLDAFKARSRVPPL
jgi:hypothetical protein